MKKIIFSDMDGTIVDYKGVRHPRDKEMIQKLRENGHYFAFCTGRNEKEAQVLIDTYGFPYDFLVLNNGAHIVNQQGKDLFREQVPGNIGKEIIQHCLNYENMNISFYNGKHTIGLVNGKTCLFHLHGFVETDLYNFHEEYPKMNEFDIIALAQNDKKINHILNIQNHIKEMYGEIALGTLNTIYLDITAANCSKGTGITTLCNLLNEDLQTYCIGDSFNDISMFKVADHPYSFKHVDDEIKKHSKKQVNFVYELLEDALL
ncbi:HAD family phosphatase [Bacillus sp. AGMB 02131]|uniref:HAD family phosphatase n=1 Tax=Peribacillus faecalis TaxID=2772559 RepID=A0A927CXP8_9BACI|nr:HAD-IIB family hydrolase [Peribacillus faecalis]MBD3107234.1 HAD family phosphatase [Peribacillus faecalis]